MNWLTRFKRWRLRRGRIRAYKKAARGVSARLSAEVQKRYAAAKPSRLEHHSLGWMRDFNSLVEAANPRLRERVRGLTRNFPPFVRAINAHSAFVIGQGGRFQSLVTDDDGRPDKRTRERLESRFLRWMEKASIDGRLHFYECQRLALRQRMECGEFFCAFRAPKAKGRHPLALQFIEPDRIQGGLEVDPVRSDSVVWQGIEFDPETGERYAYHVLKEQFPPRYQWGYDAVEDARLIHGYEVLRPGQLRGVTIFAPAIILADNMGDYIDAELDAAKMAAKWLAFVTSNNTLGFQQKRSRPGGPTINDSRLEDIENCVIEYLENGDQIQLAPSSGRVGDSFDRFTRFVLRMIGICIGTPYEVLSGDYSGINYSTSRMNRQDYNMILAPDRFWLENSISRPVFREWLRLEALTENYLPGYFRDPAHYEKAMFVPSGMPSPDPLREGKADIDNLKAGLDNPMDIILRRGGDPERNIEKLAEYRDLLAEKGVSLDLNTVSTALQTNPDKLDELGDNDLSSFEESD
jgi:lambda family phage portal protein